jgi:hypothetical protein
LTKEKNAVIEKAAENRMNRFFQKQAAKEIESIERSITQIDKYSKRLGYAGMLLSAGVLTYKYFDEGITKKDLFDAAISVTLMALTISNPIGIIGLGVYGLIDATGALDGIKNWMGFGDQVIFKNK